MHVDGWLLSMPKNLSLIVYDVLFLPCCVFSFNLIVNIKTSKENK